MLHLSTESTATAVVAVTLLHVVAEKDAKKSQESSNETRVSRVHGHPPLRF
jgi:hypothetical protein